MRIRKNGGIIGDQKQVTPTGIAGIYNINSQYTGSTVTPMVAHALADKPFYPPANTNDPYRQYVTTHFSDTTAPINVFTDISGNNWDEYTQTSLTGTDPCVTLEGPTTQYHSTSFTTAEYYSANTSSGFNFGTNPFTIEFWVMPFSSDQRYVVSRGTTTLGWAVAITTTNNIAFTYLTTTVTGTQPVTRGKWNHVQILRTSTGTNGTAIYVNGVLDTSFTCATNFNDGSTFYIGTDRTNSAATVRLNAMLTDLQISNVARPAATSVPTTPYVADANTLALMSTASRTQQLLGTISSNTVSRTGALVLSAYTPYIEPDTTNVGSLYFDRTTSRIVKVYDRQTGNSSLRFAGDFTAECWFKPMEQSGSTTKNALFAKGTATTGWEAWYYTGGGYNTGGVGFINGTSETTAIGLDIYAYAWNHFALVKNGNSVQIYINGKSAGMNIVSNSGYDTETSPLYVGGTKGTVVATVTTVDSMAFISQARLSNIARYTSNFTPATTYTADANTVYMALTAPLGGDFRDNINLGTSMVPLVNGNNGWQGMNFLPFQSGWGLTQTAGDASGFYVTNNTNLQFGIGDFSLEIFATIFDITSSQATKIIMCNRSNMNADTDPGYAIKVGAYGAVEFITNGSKPLLSSTSLVKSQQWTHICIQRVNGVASLYINGNLEDQVLSTESLIPTSDTTIGYSAIQTTKGTYGRLSNLRINKGTVAYIPTARQTIPLPSSTLTPVTGTVLLTACGPRMTDYASPATANVITQKNNPWNITGNVFTPFPVTQSDMANMSNAISTLSSGTAATTTSKEPTNRSYLWMNQGVPFTIEGWVFLPAMNYTTPSAVNMVRTTSNTVNGWSVTGNHNGSAAATGYLSFRMYGSSAGSGIIVTTNTAVLNPCSFNHYAIVYDGTKIAIFVNGVNAYSGAASVAAINVAATTGALEQFESSCELKISTVAVYSTSASTIPVPTSVYTASSTTHTLYRNRSFNPDTSYKSRVGRSSTSSILYSSRVKKKFGNGAIGFRQLDATAVDRLAWGSGSGWIDHRAGFIRFTDYTLEMWANWSRGTTPNANVLCHFNNIKILSDATGNWRLSYADTIFLNTTTPVARDSNFDHVAITRLSDNYNLFINGIFQGTLSVNRPGTTTNDLEDIQSTYATEYSLGSDNSSTLATRWYGYVQDFRVTAQVARYVPYVINGVATMVHVDTKTPALPTALLPTF